MERTSSVSQPDLLILAQQGDARAIGFLINQALRTKNITAQVSRQDHHLYLLLEGQQLPAEMPCVHLVQNGMARLKPAPIHRVTLYGRQVGQNRPTWTHVLTLKTVSPPTPAPAPAEVQQQIAAQLRQVIQAPPPASPASPRPATAPKKRVKKSSSSPMTATRPLKGVVTPVKKHPEKQRPNSLPQTGSWLIIVSLILSPMVAGVLFFRSSQLQAWLTPVVSSESSAVPAPVVIAENSPVPVVSPTTTATNSPLPTTPPLPNSMTTLPQLTVPETLEVAINTLKPFRDANTEIILKAVGDMVLGTNFPYHKLPSSGALLFEGITPLLQEADLVFGNYESTLTDHPYSAKDISRGMVFAFRSPPSYSQYLKAAGFNILSIANNHSFDFGDKGFQDTMKYINQTGMQAFGDKNQIIYETVKGVSVAFIGFSYFDDHNSMHDLASGEKIVQQAQENSDIVVISVHASAEGSDAVHVRNQTEYFYGENRGNLVKFSRAMIDAGADLILGHGPHVPRAMEVYNGKLIAYSLGNFIGYRTLSTVGNLGYSLVLEVRMNPDGDFISGKIHPVKLDSSGIPYPDQGGSSIQLIQTLTQTDFPNTPLKIDREGNLTLN